MDEFPIMAMREGDEVTVITEWETVRGTVNWWDRYEGFRVSVKTEDGDRVFPDGPNRWAKFRR